MWTDWQRQLTTTTPTQTDDIGSMTFSSALDEPPLNVLEAIYANFIKILANRQMEEIWLQLVEWALWRFTGPL